MIVTPEHDTVIGTTDGNTVLSAWHIFELPTDEISAQVAITHIVKEIKKMRTYLSVFCPGFQKGRVPSEKGTLAR